ncbi:hypothetical protein L198_07574 [Cryptococcus wingfieldii CBS 7118]|uniref:Uncharacterized protein n=1 Tax=Cryptococcus wingfieldii CBS 7118 TaxID=1295528 RepID=A0A1E3IBV0_9TREE|nr:hypothetical protein L198_07574 [Cryptococcus wingfieldii CBS 7118]ODN85251.1 hypothetical protein L198_07574 [Cryptococcus wingfieldii CBS 7118]
MADPVSCPMTKSSKSSTSHSSSSFFPDNYSPTAPTSPASPSNTSSAGNPNPGQVPTALPTPMSFSGSRENAKGLELAPPLSVGAGEEGGRGDGPMISPNTEAIFTPARSPGHRTNCFPEPSPRSSTAPGAGGPASPRGSAHGAGPGLRGKASMSHMDTWMEDLSLSGNRGEKGKETEREKARKGKGYNTYESCMNGALGHDTKAATYKIGTEKAYHHLNRSNELFLLAMDFRINDKKALLGRSRILIQLASNYQPPRVATESLRDAVDMLRTLVGLAPHSLTARETLAEGCSLLSAILHETEDYIEDESRVWSGEIGELAREALAMLEDVAADRMDKMRAMSSNEAAQLSPDAAELFLKLSDAALKVSAFAMDLQGVELHIELAEQALDQASNMATVAATSRIKSSSATATLIARVQHASSKSSLERLRHTFTLGLPLDEEDFRALLADMEMLATESRARVAKARGSKAGSLATLAWETVKLVGDAEVLYANLLRGVWRNRKPRRRSGGVGKVGTPTRRTSTRDLVDAIREEDEPEEGQAKVVGPASAPAAWRIPGRRESASSNGSDGVSSRKGSAALGAAAEGAELLTFPNRGRFLSSVSVPATGRRGSWLPSPGDVALNRAQRRRSSLASPLSQSFTGLLPEPQTGHLNGLNIQRTRRASSTGGSLVLPDGQSAWSRRASVISLSSDDGSPSASISSSALARSAWQLLESAVHQYKIGLNILSSSALPNAELAKAKNETLVGIAYASLFMASLSPRLAVAAERRETFLVTAEVYTTWAAREVGWSFLIEGTKAAEMADRRTNSWRADEAGKRAVLLLVRIWWHRAVTTQAIDVETKRNAKDAVETVVKRMKEKEGTREGDVFRVRWWLSRQEGEIDTAEGLFWRSVCRILKGGPGFVMG